MNKYKLLSIPIIAITFSLFCGCSKNATKITSEEKLYEIGMDVVETMVEMVESDEYTALMGMTDHISTVREEVLYSDYSEPLNVYSITLPDIEKLLPVGRRGQWDNLSDTLKEQVERRFSVATIATTINGQYGSEHLAFASTYQTISKVESLNIEEPIYYLYVFEDAPSVLVSFSEKPASGLFVFAESSDVKKLFRAQKCTLNKIR